MQVAHVPDAQDLVAGQKQAALQRSGELGSLRL
jgi:hypothetical protein